MSHHFSQRQWALILGGSSGFGLASAKKLGQQGMSIAVVHRDRKGAMEPIEREFEEMRKLGIHLLTFNMDALLPSARSAVLDVLSQALGDSGGVRLLLHSIAFGNLKLLVPTPPRFGEDTTEAQKSLSKVLDISEERLHAALREVASGPHGGAALSFLRPVYDPSALLDEEDFARTLYAMGSSLASWTQELFVRKLFAKSARVIGLTSEGNEVAWRGYAAVSAAKAALEAIVRSIAVEYAPYGVRANVLQPGVCDTPALARIPGSAHMKAQALHRNPCGRLTRPEDVANVISLLCTDDADWVNGALLRVDGGERIGA